MHSTPWYQISVKSNPTLFTQLRPRHLNHVLASGLHLKPCIHFFLAMPVHVSIILILPTLLRHDRLLCLPVRRVQKYKCIYESYYVEIPYSWQLDFWYGEGYYYYYYLLWVTTIMQGNYNYIPEQTISLGLGKVAFDWPGKNYR